MTRKPTLYTAFLFALTLFTASACATNPPTPGPSPTPATAQSFSEQVSLGQTLYAQSCAKCHGDSGQGNPGPRVVGIKEGALPLDPPASRKVRKSQFVTVADVAEFVTQNMPPKKAGSLTPEQYWAILAFDLHANGIDLPSPLTPELAKTLTIPR